MTRSFAGVLVCLACGVACAQPPEPPPEAGEGDYTLERADSVAAGEVEVVVGAAGAGNARARGSQRVSFRGGGASGTIREGDDALAGGRVAAPFARGTLVAGRLAPRWGQGLLLGGAADPWARSALDRGTRARFRGRAGEGLAYESGAGAWVAGRFDGTALAAVRGRAGRFGAGVVAARAQTQWSASFEEPATALELALARGGQWRAEGAVAVDEGPLEATLRARAGTRGFRPLAEPKRTGPAHALAFSVAWPLERVRAEAFGAAWRWAGGRTGARAALEVGAGMGQHGSFAVGLEQQHGARREPSPRTRPGGVRQGVWAEWRGGSPAARLSLRHELWGARAFARDAVRRAMVARFEGAVPLGGRVAVTHAVWSVRRGETLYLPEPAADRLVLRSLSGSAGRTRSELALPFAGGEVRLALVWRSGGTRDGTTPPTWTVEWSRRSRLAQARADDGEGGGDALRGADGTTHDRGVVRHARARQGARGTGP